MISIRIITAPAGQAPEWVREKWIGVTIPLTKPFQDGFECGVLGGESSNENSGGYEVDSTEAINALSSVSPEAAHWWLEYSPPYPGKHFLFARGVCELVL